MDIPKWPGWHLIGRYPEGDPDGVGSWLLHHGGEAALLEVPPGLTVKGVRSALEEVGANLKYMAVSHTHWDHWDRRVWNAMLKAFPLTLAIDQTVPRRGVWNDRELSLSWEPLWLVRAPKHSPDDVVTVFRGVAMTGDIETGTLKSVSDEVPMATRRRSMAWLAGFEERQGYRVHSTVSAHLNSVREGVDWRGLFECEEVSR